MTLSKHIETRDSLYTPAVYYFTLRIGETIDHIYAKARKKRKSIDASNTKVTDLKDAQR